MKANRRIWALLLAVSLYAPWACANPSGAEAEIAVASLAGLLYTLGVFAFARQSPALRVARRRWYDPLTMSRADFAVFVPLIVVLTGVMPPLALVVLAIHFLIAGLLLVVRAAVLERAKDRPAVLQPWRYAVAGWLMLLGIPLLVVVPVLAHSLGFSSGRYGIALRADPTKALEEIKSIELELMNVLTDTGANSLAALYVSGEREGGTGPYANGVLGYLGYDCGEFTMAQMEKAQQLYTRSLSALLRSGRNAMDEYDDELGIGYGDVLHAEVVARLGEAYLDIGRDPWGEPYQIWPGPWPDDRLSRFRVYVPEYYSPPFPGQEARGPDALSCNTESSREAYRGIEFDRGEVMEPFGFPARKMRMAFIWSCGQNLVSGQLTYVNEPAPGHCDSGQADNASRWGYNKHQDTLYFGGGDDINNWDNGRSWEVFYN